MEISFLNHASVVVEDGPVKLLMDPWLEGTCFEDGWGLRYHNAAAFEKVKYCTHLWISHFHQDHFHRPTLKKILDLNPDIVLLGNRSYNFQLDSAGQKLGFKNIVSVYERRELQLSEGLSITRFPTQGIDNMLLIKTPAATVLNYNDCVIPSLTQKLLKKRFGTIDILLTNFNHAGKLLLYPFPSAERIREKLIKNFSENFSVFNPRYVLPFASYHYYRSPYSAKQNDTMLTSDDLIPVDSRIVPWKVGDKFVWQNGSGWLQKENAVTTNDLHTIGYPQPSSVEELLTAATAFASVIKKRFGVLSRFFPTLYIEAADIGSTFAFSPKRGGFLSSQTMAPHIKAHSQALMNWFSKPYGTDSFVVGAHFDIVNGNRIPLKWQLALGLLVENKMDLKSMLGMLFKKQGRRFLLNRREEFIGQLFQFKLTASYQEND